MKKLHNFCTNTLTGQLRLLELSPWLADFLNLWVFADTPTKVGRTLHLSYSDGHYKESHLFSEVLSDSDWFWSSLSHAAVLYCIAT